MEENNADTQTALIALNQVSYISVGRKLRIVHQLSPLFISYFKKKKLNISKQGNGIATIINTLHNVIFKAEYKI